MFNRRSPIAQMRARQQAMPMPAPTSAAVPSSGFSSILAEAIAAIPDHIAPPPRPLFGAELLAEGVITTDQLQVALHEQTRAGGMVGQILLRLGYLDDRQLCVALAQRAGLPVLTADDLSPDLALLRRLPHGQAMRWQLLPLGSKNGRLRVACADPFDLVAQNQFQSWIGATVEIDYALAPSLALRQAIERSYGLGSQADTLQPAPAAEDIAPWLLALLQEALDQDASDLHFLPQQAALLIRLRVDGLLHTVKTMHRDFWPALLQRLKILAAVNIAETRRPQDGRFSQSLGDGVVLDCRAAFMPTTHGEAVTLRLLDPRRAGRSFASMGFTPAQIARFHDWLRRPEGLVLVTGPTGSGKSTTLNAMLQAVDRRSRNIMTLEDPVEYHFPGIRQTQVQEQQGLGFAEGVRTLLRHDPDVILIGEIRDADTAQQAMRAAMTGHLVLSSLHSGSARGAVPRLLDLGVGRDLLAQHLRGVVAQRLVRTLCPHCQTKPETLRLVRPEPVAPSAPASGCPHCFGTGRRGRTVVAELLALPENADVLFGADTRYQTMWQQGQALLAAGRIAADDLAASVPRPD